MYILAYYIIPGIILGFLLPTDQREWLSFISVVAVAYSVVTMAVELVRGKAKARSWRSRLAAALDAEEDSAIVEAAVIRASIVNQFIYKFHLAAFVIGCLTIAVPVAVLSVITYSLRCWLG